jgi:hypothetical protein
LTSATKQSQSTQEREKKSHRLDRMWVGVGLRDFGAALMCQPIAVKRRAGGNP